MSDPRLNWEKIETEERVIIPTEDGLGIAAEIKVKVPATRDPTTGEIYLGEDALQILDDVKARHLGLLTRDQLKRLRERLHCTQGQLCSLLQLGKKTWTRWETGRERPSRSMNLLLCALYEGRIDVRWLLAHQHPARPFARATSMIRQLVYAGSAKSSTEWIAACAQPELLPGLETRIQNLVNRSIWMNVTEGWNPHERSGQHTQMAGTVVYHRSASAPPWNAQIADSDALTARCTQAPVVPGPETLA